MWKIAENCWKLLKVAQSCQKLLFSRCRKKCIILKILLDNVNILHILTYFFTFETFFNISWKMMVWKVSLSSLHTPLCSIMEVVMVEIWRMCLGKENVCFKPKNCFEFILFCSSYYIVSISPCTLVKKNTIRK